MLFQLTFIHGEYYSIGKEMISFKTYIQTNNYFLFNFNLFHKILFMLCAFEFMQNSTIYVFAVQR